MYEDDYNGVLPGDVVTQNQIQQMQQQPGFDPSKVPNGVPVEWAQDFISRNPGDYHRLESAYASDIKPKGGAAQTPNYATPTQQWNNSALQQRSSDLYQLLMQRAQQGTAIDRNDPNVRAQVDPLVAQQERATRNYLDALAEKAGPLANIQGEQRLAAERSGQAAGQLESEVIGREMDARRQEISQALSMWGSMLSNDERLALEKELAYLSDATTRRGQDITTRGQDLSNDQFLRELALRQYDLGNEWDYRWSGLGG